MKIPKQLVFYMIVWITILGPYARGKDFSEKK